MSDKISAPISEPAEIIEAEVEEVRLGSLLASSPADVIKRASAVATELKKIITTRKLYVTISGKEFVRVEGWSTLGAMLGILPRERDVKEIVDGFEAYVELVRASDGMVLGGASAICNHREHNWEGRDEFAVRSMAITRATGKAFRLAFSWIMTLAGYEPTPAEEMIGVIDEAPKPPKIKTTRPYTPAMLRMKLAEASVKYKNETITDGQRGIIVNIIEKTLKDKTARYELCEFLLGEASSKKWMNGQLAALWHWLAPEKDEETGEWIPSSDAVREMHSSHSEALISKGQQKLPGARAT